MSEPKWTSGSRRIIRFDEAQTVVIASGKTVAVFTGADKAANAQLDATAPDLYAALEALLKLEVVATSAAMHSEIFAAYNAARAALAKARGEV